MTRVPSSIPKDSTLVEAHELMRKHKIRHLPVTDGGKLAGIVSQRDLHLVETLRDVDPEEVPVEDAMTRDVYVVAPSEPLMKVAAKMAHDRIGSAIIVGDRGVEGIFTTTDALIALFHIWKPS